MSVVQALKIAVSNILLEKYNYTIPTHAVLINDTKPEFEGNYTVVLFSLLKPLQKSPETLGNELGHALLNGYSAICSGFNIVKGFLNITISHSYWIHFLQQQYNNNTVGFLPSNAQTVMVEYSSPNTNKPLHLGHLRNNFLGLSIANVLEAQGYKVAKTCIVNDRGIHICKSMIAWQRFANGATPESTGKKGDHFVGDYYVKFNDAYKAEVETLVIEGMPREQAEKQAPILLATQQMLLDWEAGNPTVMQLWNEMNAWVYNGFNTTYQTIGSKFDKTYYESNTYLLGKKIVEQGLEKKVFFKKEDGSVWIDLTADGLDEKLVMRKDGTSVYITQDIGLAEQKQQEFAAEKSIYVVGDEQNYHFKVLQLICKKLGLPRANGIYHLSYGMVELPTGKMKSREGTVVDADDLVAEMIQIAKQKTEELGKVNDFTTPELTNLYNTIGLGALKFFLLRVDPKKKMIFNPEESIDFHGFTGPFVQYTYARIQSILRKVDLDVFESIENETLLTDEKNVLLLLEKLQSVIAEAATEHDPSKIAIYVFNVAKTFNSFYANVSISKAETASKKQLRLKIAKLTGATIKNCMALLGIDVPERM